MDILIITVQLTLNKRMQEKKTEKDFGLANLWLLAPRARAHTHVSTKDPR